MSFKFEKMKIKDIIVITPEIHTDKRGSLTEVFKVSAFMENGINKLIFQENETRSKKGVLRGLHYQIKPYDQSKLIRCVKGKIFDVAVDIRKNSDTFGKWVGIEISSENKKMVYIPSGFAHGFYTLTDNAVINYKLSFEYFPEAQRSIKWNDPDLNIKWPEGDKLLSEKDKKAQSFKDAELFL